MGRLDRIEWMDAARGLGIILVVFGHVERGLVSANIAVDHWWRVADYVIYTFHMPLFFFLSGVNAPKPLIRGRVVYLKSKIWTVIYPYFLWSLIQGVVLVVASSATNGKTEFDQLISIPWNPMGQFWFLWVLMACHVVIAISGVNNFALILISLISFVFSQFSNGLLKHFLHDLPFFLIGAHLSGWAARLPQAKENPLVIGVWGGGIALALLSLEIVPVSEFESFWALPACIAGIFATIWSVLMLKGKLLAAFVYLGEASMTIYVLHVMAAAGLRIFMVRLHIPHIDWLYAAFCTAFGVFFPLMAHVVMRKLKILWWFGLASPPKKLAVSS